MSLKIGKKNGKPPKDKRKKKQEKKSNLNRQKDQITEKLVCFNFKIQNALKHLNILEELFPSSSEVQFGDDANKSVSGASADRCAGSNGSERSSSEGGKA